MDDRRYVLHFETTTAASADAHAMVHPRWTQVDAVVDGLAVVIGLILLDRAAVWLSSHRCRGIRARIESLPSIPAMDHLDSLPEPPRKADGGDHRRRRCAYREFGRIDFCSVVGNYRRTFQRQDCRIRPRPRPCGLCAGLGIRLNPGAGRARRIRQAHGRHDLEPTGLTRN
jgi:hypothetical protein